MISKVKLAKRSRLVDAANRSLHGLNAFRLLGSQDLDAEAICDSVCRATGLNDFGDEWFRQPLAVLVEALREEAQLNPLGHFAAVGQLRKVLKDRLWAERILSGHPEIEQRSLASPVIVVGPMRSGTTRLHRLLAADRRFAHMRSFETINPVPRPGFRPGDRDARWIVARLATGAVHRFNPTTAVIHPSGPFQPEEELGLLVRSIWSMKHEVQWHVPTYARWSEEQDATPAYRYMARLLRLIGWARGEDDSRPWVLKTPQHMLDLPALLRVFPDARIIFTHRDPQSVVGSSCSLVWNQMIIHSDRVDAGAIGRDWLRKTDLQIKRMRKARLAIPASQRIDVRYEEMERDWQGVMRRIYRFLDMEIAPAVPAMVSYMANSGRKLHRHPHRYALSDFGLDPGEVCARFTPYAEAFDLRRTDVAEEFGKVTPAPEPVMRPAVPQVADWSVAKPARALAGRR